MIFKKSYIDLRLDGQNIYIVYFIIRSNFRTTGVQRNIIHEIHQPGDEREKIFIPLGLVTFTLASLCCVSSMSNIRAIL